LKDEIGEKVSIKKLEKRKKIATKRMGIKFDRKKTNEDEIKKIMSNKINSNYMNGNQI
jgi:hypothetical protein